jgi:hypothetical protein
MRKALWALAALTLVLGITTAATGSVAGVITGQGIKNYSITSVDLKNHTIQAHDMSSTLLSSLRNPDEANHAFMSDWSAYSDQATTADKATTADTAGTAANATTVGGYLPTSLMRTASATQGEKLALTETYQKLATLSIVAPQPGFVFVTATAKAETGAEETYMPSVAVARLRDAEEGGPVSGTTVASVSDATPYATLAATWVFPVTSGGAHAYVLEAYQQNGDAMNLYGGVVTAIYVPFGSTGTAAP